MVTHFQQHGTVDLEVDTSGTRCPIPLLKAKQALKTMLAGQLLAVISTDPSSIGDFEAMLKHLPHELLATAVGEDSDSKTFHVLIRKA